MTINIMLFLKKYNKQKYWIITGLLASGLILIGLLVYKSFVEESSSNTNSSLTFTNFNVNTSANVQTIHRPTKESGEPNRISIPDRKINAPIVYITETSEKVYQDALSKGVVHYPDTALPGEYGNCYIFGHSSDYMWKLGEYKAIFKPLVDIPLNTEIRITNPDGELFIYKVIETKIVGPKETSVLDQYNYQKRILTLQTSWPINTALKRYLVIAELDDAATFATE